ncbi:hypothetical protein L0B70_01120 [Kaistella sp. 97-N-M2]|uniref:hypothetical protein n=1 Tax=Kaistella sp. 97-N-M2 TaxID=2908645 RepID=UPI001F295D3A|nr:hypothetical protein [Kaistella sp. 97-N-M2]UJF30026.1 hypothetical protein L0B70_01120 [Kaistella sp. 97-N-M2]
MENSIIDIKNELIEWIENTYDLEILRKIVNLKEELESNSLIADINSESAIENNFDQQFAAGMNSDELMENIASHIESIGSTETSSVVSDTKSEYISTGDDDERVANGVPHHENNDAKTN